MIRINVLQVITGNDNGGGGIHVLNICDKGNKYFSNSICCIGCGELYENSKEKRINTYLIDKVTSTKEFISLVNENDFDIINFHGAKANFLHMLIKNKLMKPCVVTVHSDFRYDFLNNKFKKVLYTPLSKISLRSYENFICVSKKLKELLDKNNFHGSKWAISNGISFNVDYNEYEKKSVNFKKEYDIDENDFVYVYVARMHPIKNHNKLIDAFSKLLKHISNVKLVLVGDGELMDSLKKKCETLGIDKKVIFVGQQKDTLKFIQISDIAMLTSFNEGGMPTMTILESAVMRKPMICSNIGDLQNIINEKTGYLMNPDSEEDIMNKMLLAYNEKVKLSEMGEKLHLYIRKYYSMDIFHENYNNIYKNIINKEMNKVS